MKKALRRAVAASAALVLFLVSPFFADAALLGNSSQRFTPFEQWIKLQSTPTQALWTKISGAVLQVESDSGPCSATRIDSNGLFLTARHCLQKCLIQKGVFQPVLEQGALTYYQLDRQKLGRTTCEVKVSGKSTEVIIRSTSPGLVMKMDELSLKVINPELMSELRAKGYMASGDFVVFSAGEEWQAGPHLKFSQNSIQAGESVASIGFPTETFRPDGFNSDGKNKFISRGSVLSGIEASSCLESIPNLEKVRARLIDIFDEPTSFISTLDAVYGSSGSPVLNSRGEIVGILTNVFRLSAFTKLAQDEPEKIFCSGSTKALRAERIIELMSQNHLL